MDFLLSNQIITFIIGIAALIFIHELGHFFAARLLKVDVEEFGIGFPPRLVKLFEAGGTEFTLNWIPLGGFVRLKGENDPDVEGGFSSASPWVRLGVLVAGPLSNLLVGLVLAIALVLNSGILVPDRIVVSQIIENTPAEQANLMEDDIILAINGVAIENQDMVTDLILENAGREVDFQIERDGEVQGITVNLGKESEALGVVYTDGEIIELQGVRPGSPADDAGLQAGDRILAVNDTEIVNSTQFESLIAIYAGRAAQIAYERDGEVLTTNAELDERKYALGIGYNNARRMVGVPEAIQAGTSDFSSIVHAILTLPVQLIRGDVAPEQARPVGYVGMFTIYQDLQSPLFFFMLISISLGIFNLLPIPALDGGRIALILPEILLRRRVPARYENMIHLVGFIFLILVMVWVNINDIINPIDLPG